jgi:hypothetical protein
MHPMQLCKSGDDVHKYRASNGVFELSYTSTVLCEKIYVVSFQKNKKKLLKNSLYAADLT